MMDKILLAILLTLLSFLVYGIIMCIKEAYLAYQWKKLLTESEKVFGQNLSGHELVFELDYLNQEYTRLKMLETKMFPYLIRVTKVDKRRVV